MADKAKIGRPKGSLNKISSQARQIMQRWLDMHNSCITNGSRQELIWEDFMQLEPKDRVKISLEFIKLVTPRNIKIEDTTSASTLGSRLSALATEGQLTEDDETENDEDDDT